MTTNYEIKNNYVYKVESKNGKVITRTFHGAVKRLVPEVYSYELLVGEKIKIMVAPKEFDIEQQGFVIPVVEGGEVIIKVYGNENILHEFDGTEEPIDYSTMGINEELEFSSEEPGKYLITISKEGYSGCSIGVVVNNA